MTSSSRFYVASRYEPGRLLVFGSNGALEQVVGEPGRGPREFDRILSMAVDEFDSLHVFHGNRRSVVAPNGSIVRSSVVAGQVNTVIPIGAGRLILGGSFPGPERIGLPLHLMAGEEIVDSFGPEGQVTPGSFVGLERLALGQQSTIWVLPIGEYRISEWVIGAKEQPRRAFLQARDGWFDDEWDATTYDIRRPHLAGIRQTADGILWIMGVVMDQADPLPDSLAQGRMPDVDRMVRHFRTVIEVIDPNTATVLDVRTVPALVGGFLNDSLAFGYQIDDSGDTVIDVFQYGMGGRSN